MRVRDFLAVNALFAGIHVAAAAAVLGVGYVVVRVVPNAGESVLAGLFLGAIALGAALLFAWLVISTVHRLRR